MARQPKTPVDEARAERGTLNDQPKAYMVAFFVGENRWEQPRPYFIDADLTPGVALQETAAKLNALLRGFITAANVRKIEEIRTCRLELTEFGNTTGRADLVWAVSWDPE